VKTVTFYILASVWSTSSLRTSISKVSFSLAVDGFGLGASQVSDSSWDPGQYARYNVTFIDPQESPTSLPLSSTLTLAVTAYASAGIAASSVSASDQSLQAFGETSC